MDKGQERREDSELRAGHLRFNPPPPPFPRRSANFYDQNELCGLTWFEQLSASPTYSSSYYSPRFLISVPTILTYVACHMADYNINTVTLNMVILFVLVLSKQDFMYGVRVFGINRTVGVDDGSKQISREGSEIALNNKVKGN